MQKMILLCRHFCSRTFSFFHVDIFVIIFRCTNILFGPPSCRLRYFSKDKRKMLWEHKHCYCGVEGKMMRASPRMWGGEEIENEIERLVKILTKCKMKLRSRREEIKWNCGIQLAAARVLLRSASSHIIPLSLPPPIPTSPHSSPPSLSAAMDQKSNILQLSLLQLFCSSLSSS